MQLAATDYGNFLHSEGQDTLQSSVIADRLTNRLVDEFNYVRNNAEGPLAKFLEYMTCVFRSS